MQSSRGRDRQGEVAHHNYLTAYGKATIAPLGDDLLGNPVVSTNLAEVQYGPAYG